MYGRSKIAWLALILLAAGCAGEGVRPDGGTSPTMDGGASEPAEAGPDAARDAGPSTGMDATDGGRFDTPDDRRDSGFDAPRLDRGPPVDVQYFDIPLNSGLVPIWQRRSSFNPNRALPPRLIGPLSGWKVNTQRPTLGWVLPAGLTRARVELCRDRACTMELRRNDVTGSRYRVEPALPPGVLYWRVRGLDAAGQVQWSSATWQLGIPRRDNGGDYVTGPIRDFDGDGFDDFAVEVEDSPPSAEVFHGRSNLSDVIRRTRIVLEGATTRHTDHTALSWADLDDDGRSNLLMGAYEDLDPSATGSVWSAASSVPDSTLRRLGMNHLPLHGEAFGLSVASCDVDGDGSPESMISSLPRTWLARGAAGTLVSIWPSDPAFRLLSADCLGDVNGDGYGDIGARMFPVRGADAGNEDDTWIAILVGGPQGPSPMEYVYLTPPSGDFGELASLGYHVRWGGDIDQDGVDDMLVSALGISFVVYGDPRGDIGRRFDTLLFVDRSGPGTPFGTEAGSGDFNGDGRLEVVVSAPCAPSNGGCGPGRVYLFPHVNGRISSQGSLIAEGDPLRSDFGSGLVSDADLNADGYHDLIIARQSGREIYVVSGGTMGLDRARLLQFDFSGGSHPLAGYTYVLATAVFSDDRRLVERRRGASKWPLS